MGYAFLLFVIALAFFVAAVEIVRDTRSRMKLHARKKAIQAARWGAIFETTDLRQPAGEVVNTENE